MPKRDLKFYAECTATGRREAEAGADARAADLLEAIDKVPTGRFLLQVELQKRGSQAPSIRLLREGLTSWLASLDHLAAIDEFREANRVSEWTWTERDWRIKFAALPAEAQPEEDEGALGIIGPHDLDMTQHLRLRRALDIKASGYGTLDHPLLVVANSTEYQRERDLMIALLGDVVWDVDLRRSHASERFLLNGVFGSPAKPRNVVLSAAMHGHFDALNFTLPDRTFSLTHHPFARHPLPRKLFPFCKERYFESETGQMVIIEPKVTVTEFFGLPKDWPGFDRDPR
ncbi:MAG: hypothetical protein Q7T05_00620 [Dehalococcoidia bacterium]|nr:hypothetical protein [Dehalococcoidia bacterium]